MNEPAEGSFGLANGLRDGEGPVDWIMAGKSVVMIKSPTFGCKVASRLLCFWDLEIDASSAVSLRFLDDSRGPVCSDYPSMMDDVEPALYIWSCDEVWIYTEVFACSTSTLGHSRTVAEKPGASRVRDDVEIFTL